MKIKNLTKNGFTLVELLVVIAIIGILSSVAVVNLNSARDKAKIAAIEQTMASFRPLVSLCFNEDYNLLVEESGPTYCDGLSGAPVSGQLVCEASGVDVRWPILENIVSGWAFTGDCNSDYISGVWEYAATDGTNNIICDQIGCTTS
ncbi:prepilin-type N-terminal cleavage/methylation domain-containing protein [Candidatus Nomurabacteria bacterium]|nr:prepilin-type N-terminal cleavage/methylation domain-containing protein [Candidatus Nomurabacteria bacterium]